jgi:hypothetical protein
MVEAARADVRRHPGHRAPPIREWTAAGLWERLHQAVLDQLGVRVEELLEITQLALVSYRLPDTGEAVPLLQIVPSKSDQERLLLISPERRCVQARQPRQATRRSRRRPRDADVPARASGGDRPTMRIHGQADKRSGGRFRSQYLTSVFGKS